MMWGNAYCGPGGWGPGGGGQLLHGGFMLLVLVVLSVGLLLLWRIARGPRDSQDSKAAGLAALDERYARGEIEREEYLQKKQDITS